MHSWVDGQPADSVPLKDRGLAKVLEPALLETRRDIHAHPELGNTEKRTAVTTCTLKRGVARSSPASSR